MQSNHQNKTRDKVRPLNLNKVPISALRNSGSKLLAMMEGMSLIRILKEALKPILKMKMIVMVAKTGRTHK